MPCWLYNVSLVKYCLYACILYKRYMDIHFCYFSCISNTNTHVIRGIFSFILMSM